VNAVKQLEAQEMMVKMQAHDYPNLKKDDKTRIHRRIHRIAYPEMYEHNNCMSMEDAAKKLGTLTGQGK